MVYSFKNNQKGQALLVVVLVMIIALTVGLSLASRTITGIKTSTEEADSRKALSAAEAGVEQLIKDPNRTSFQNKSVGDDLGTTYSTKVLSANSTGTSFLVNSGELVQKDDSADVWLSSYSTNPSLLYASPTDANISIYFGTSQTPCQNAALEVDVIYGTKAVPKLSRYAYDPCPQRIQTNKFTASTSTNKTIPTADGTGSVTFHQMINPPILISSGLFIRITPIYFDTKLGVSSCSNTSNCTSPGAVLPSQGSIITAVGTSGSTKRSVSVYQGFPKIPAEFFPYTLFAP